MNFFTMQILFNSKKRSFRIDLYRLLPKLARICGVLHQNRSPLAGT